MKFIKLLFMLMISFLMISLTNIKVDAVGIGHMHDGIPFTVPLNNYLSTSPTTLEANQYYLVCDTQLQNDLTIAEGDVVVLCLAGHVLDLNGYHIINNGTFGIFDCEEFGEISHYFEINNDNSDTIPDGLWTLVDYETANEVVGGVITGGKVSTTYDNYGGAIYNKETGTLNVHSGAFVGNQAINNNSHGGAIHNSGVLSLSNAKIIGNYSQSYGCGVSSEGETYIYNCEFSCNVNTDDCVGGGFYFTPSYDFGCTIEQSIFTNNEVEEAGGLYIIAKEGYEASIYNCEFSYNFAETAAAGYIQNGILEDCTISYNYSTGSCGGLYFVNSTMYNSVVTYNSANSNAGGLLVGMTVYLDGCTISNNTGSNGAGIYTPSGKVVLNDTTITNNTAIINAGGVYINVPSGCFVSGTKILMADGTKKNIEDITEGEYVKTFDHNTGKVSSEKVYLTYKSEEDLPSFTLHFTNNIDLSIVVGHSLLEKSSLQYIYIDQYNVKDYIGKYFYNAENNTWEQLLNYTINKELTSYYTLYTAHHLNYIAEGMLNVTDDMASFLNCFEMDESLKYDAVKMNADIEKYGLVEYSEDYNFDYELFDSFLYKYAFVVLGKGYITQKQIDNAKQNGIGRSRRMFLGAEPRKTHIDFNTKYTGITSSRLIILDNVTINNNTADSRVENVYLNKNDTNKSYIIVDNEEATNNNIGVTLSDGTGEFVLIVSKENIDNVKSFFTSDNTKYKVVEQDNTTSYSLNISSNEIESTTTDPSIPADVKMEYDGGFDSNITVEVEVTVETNVESAISSSALMIDYYNLSDDSIKLANNEKIGVVFGVKLIRTISGTPTEIQPSDIKPGAVITVKMLIPASVDLSKVTRILHVHAADDIEEFDFDPYKIEGGYYYLNVTKLSEFAFVYATVTDEEYLRTGYLASIRETIIQLQGDGYDITYSESSNTYGIKKLAESSNKKSITEAYVNCLIKIEDFVKSIKDYKDAALVELEDYATANSIIITSSYYDALQNANTKTNIDYVVQVVKNEIDDVIAEKAALNTSLSGLSTSIGGVSTALASDLSTIISQINTKSTYTISELTDVIESAKAEILAAIVDVKAELISQTNELDSALVTITGVLASNKADLIAELNSKLDAAKSSIETNISLVNTNVSEVKTKVETAIADIASAKAEILAAIADVKAELISQTNELDSALTAITGVLASNKADLIAELNSKVDAAKSSIETNILLVNTNVAEVKTKVETTISDIASAKAEILAAIADVKAELISQTNELDSALVTITGVLASNKVDVLASISSEVAAAKDSIETNIAALDLDLSTVNSKLDTIISNIETSKNLIISAVASSRALIIAETTKIETTLDSMTSLFNGQYQNIIDTIQSSTADAKTSIMNVLNDPTTGLAEISQQVSDVNDNVIKSKEELVVLINQVANDLSNSLTAKLSTVTDMLTSITNTLDLVHSTDKQQIIDAINNVKAETLNAQKAISDAKSSIENMMTTETTVIKEKVELATLSVNNSYDSLNTAIQVVENNTESIEDKNSLGDVFVGTALIALCAVMAVAGYFVIKALKKHVK